MQDLESSPSASAAGEPEHPEQVRHNSNSDLYHTAAETPKFLYLRHQHWESLAKLREQAESVEPPCKQTKYAKEPFGVAPKNISACSCLCHRLPESPGSNFDIGGSRKLLGHRSGYNSDFSNYGKSRDIPRNFEPSTKHNHLVLRRQFNDYFSPVTSMDWSRNGEVLLLCCHDSTIVLQSVYKNSVRQLYSRKYGAQCGRFVRGEQTHCIVAAKEAATPIPSAKAIAEVMGRWPYNSSLARAKLRRRACTFGRLLDCYSPTNAIATPATTCPRPTGTAGTSTTRTDSSSSLRYWDLQENRFVKTFPLPASVVYSSGLSTTTVNSPCLIMTPCTDGKIRLFGLNDELPLAIIATNIRRPRAVLHPSGRLAATQIDQFLIQLLDYNAGWTNSDYLCIDLDYLLPVEELLDCCSLGVETFRTGLCSRHDPSCVSSINKAKIGASSLGSKRYSDLFILSSLIFSRKPPHYLVVGLTSLDKQLTRGLGVVILQIDAITGSVVSVLKRESDFTEGRTVSPSEGHSEGVSDELNWDSASLFWYGSPTTTNKHLLPARRTPYLLSVSCDGSLLSCGGNEEGIVDVWSVSSGKIVQLLDCRPRTPLLSSWSPTAPVLATGFDHCSLWEVEDSRISIWDY